MKRLTKQQKAWRKILETSTDPQEIIETAAKLEMDPVTIEEAEEIAEMNKPEKDNILTQEEITAILTGQVTVAEVLGLTEEEVNANAIRAEEVIKELEDEDDEIDWDGFEDRLRAAHDEVRCRQAKEHAEEFKKQIKKRKEEWAAKSPEEKREEHKKRMLEYKKIRKNWN